MDVPRAVGVGEPPLRAPPPGDPGDRAGVERDIAKGADGGTLESPPDRTIEPDETDPGLTSRRLDGA